MSDFKTIFKQYENLLHKLAHRIHRKHYPDIEYSDIFHAVTIAAFFAHQSREKQKQQTGNYRFKFGSYLSGHINNVFRTHFKEFRKLPEVDRPPNDINYVKDIENKELISKALNKLSKKENMVVRMRICDGRTRVECAQTLKCPPYEISLIENRALNKLKQYVEKQYA